MDAKEFGQRVYQQRQRHGWTQEACAEKAGISVRTVQMIESYQIVPTIETAEKLILAFQCAWSDLLGMPRNTPRAIISAAPKPNLGALRNKIGHKEK